MEFIGDLETPFPFNVIGVEVAMMPEDSSSTALNQIIAPEVNRDRFWEAICNLARSAPIDTVLEIGSSSGDGSTSAWVTGLRDNPRKPKLFCMEVSKVRCAALEKRWGGEGFVECFLGSSVGLEQFPSEEEVARFHREVAGPLQNYPLEEVLGWLQADMEYLQSEKVPTHGIREIKARHGIDHFGAVLIDGSEFTGSAELDEVYGAEFILLDDTQTYKCHAAHRRLLYDPGYELMEEDPGLRHGYSVFRRRHRTLLDPLPPDWPVYFFTIVLNGEPFIRHHIDVLRQLPFRWQWHIVEGAATLTHDTAWSTATGGILPAKVHKDGLSVDGTSAYLDDLAQQFPGQVKIHRKPGGQLWDGKIEMVSEPLKHLFDDGLLWQVDADELWTVDQLIRGRELFLRDPHRGAAWFWCHFFVGERRLVSTRNNYSQNPHQEWLRAWNFRPGMRWLTHEPPVLAQRNKDGSWRNVAGQADFSQAETEKEGLVFQHFAYATEAQVAFKERYYGYAGAVEGWRRLQKAEVLPLRLGDTFPWVTDDTMVSSIEQVGVAPIASRNEQGNWSFCSELPAKAPAGEAAPVIVVDGVFFQFNNTGIGRVWMETLKQWVASGIADRVWLLDRGATAPKMAGIRSRVVPCLDPQNPGADAQMLQRFCDELNAEVFISTYYTAPLHTPTVALVYDMIPERLGDETESWAWKQKKLAMLQAEEIVCISEATAREVKRLIPGTAALPTSVVLLAAPPGFAARPAEEIDDFRKRYGLEKDYLLVSGERIGLTLGAIGYKNAALVFKAWSLLPQDARDNISIVCAGGKPEVEAELMALAPQAKVLQHRFSDDDLQLAYSGALALGYPSLCEGFGLPVVEAMACGCPVITCDRSSLREVAGDAGCYVNPYDAREFAGWVQRLRQNPDERTHRIRLGLEQASRFSYSKMADELAEALNRVAMARAGALPAQRGVWEIFREQQSRVAELTLEVTDGRQMLKAAVQSAKSAQKALQKLEQRLAEERDKRRKPLKHLFKRLRRKRGDAK